MYKKVIGCLVFLMAAAGSGMAGTSVDLYGNVKMAIWWDKEYDFTEDRSSLQPVLDTAGNIIRLDTLIGKDPYPLNYLEMFPKGALGINISSDKYKFCFEFGVGKDLSDYRVTYLPTGGFFYGTKYDQFARINKVYVEYFFNEYLSLILGKNDVPCNFSISNQGLFGDNGLGNSGVLDAGRRPLLQLSAKTKISNFISIDGKIAGIFPDTLTMPLTYFKWKDTVVNGVTQAVVVANIKDPKNNYRASISIPKLESALNCDVDLKVVSGNIQVAGGYQTFDVLFKNPAGLLDPNELNEARETLENYVYGACSEWKIGPVSIAGTYSRGKNFGVYGVNIGNPFKWRAPGVASSAGINVYFPWANSKYSKGDLISLDSAKNFKTLFNSYTQEMAFIGKYSPFKFLSLEGGVGLVLADNDDKSMFDRSQYNTTTTISKTTTVWYAQLCYTYADFITISPEYGFYNYGKYHYNGTYSYWGFNTAVKIPNVSLK